MCALCGCVLFYHSVTSGPFPSPPSLPSLPLAFWVSALKLLLVEVLQPDVTAHTRIYPDLGWAGSKLPRGGHSGLICALVCLHGQLRELPGRLLFCISFVSYHLADNRPSRKGFLKGYV